MKSSRIVSAAAVACFIGAVACDPTSRPATPEEQQIGRSSQAIIEDPTDNPCIPNTTGWVTISQHTVALGESITVDWHLDPTPNCQLIPYLVFRDDVAGHRSILQGHVFTPPASGAYLLTVYSLGHFYDIAADWVTVRLPQVNGHTLASITRGDQAALFAQAAATEHARIAIRGDVDLDLSHGAPIPVAQDVQIIGQLDSAHPTGPRLFTTTFQRPVLSVVGDNVRITGIRFDGQEPTDPCDVAGNNSDVDAIGIYSAQNVEIDHNELYRWMGSAVNVYDDRERNDEHNNATVYVHDNYMHDNQHPTYCGYDPWGSGHGGGYGVNSSDGAFPKIEHNVFSDNRHAIASNGAPGASYNLTGNLFFRPGIDNVKVGWTNYNHHIDVHGRGNCGDPQFPSCLYCDRRESYSCGPAGEYFIVHSNTVVGWTGLLDFAAAIQLRGTPTSYDPATQDGGMWVSENMFSQPHDAALTQTEWGLVEGGGNAFSVNLQRFYDTSSDRPCDFDGDGVTDAFRASGVTWWYHSSRQNRWINLATRSGLPQAFGDANSDGLCDVTVNGSPLYTRPIFESFPDLMTAVPSVIGSSPGAATIAMIGAGLTVANVRSVHSSAPVGTVSDVVPPAGSSLKVGSTVDINVSLGGSTVPYLYGVPRLNAIGLITGAGLVAHTSLELACIDPGKVIDQSPDPGTSVTPGSTVNMTVDTGSAHGCHLQ